MSSYRIRERYIQHPETGKLISASEYYQERKEINAPAIHGDEILDGMESMINGKVYYSKSAYKRHVKESGYEILGNDKIKPAPQKTEYTEREREKLRGEIERAYYDVRENRAPLSELDKARCKIINQQMEHYNYDNRERDRFGRL